ncbi:MAG: DUF1800 domain-containing protein [Gemmataceae bacterium]|nr:DUF1800 domain-containing protein [Gemmataceae bacterium]
MKTAKFLVFAAVTALMLQVAWAADQPGAAPGSGMAPLPDSAWNYDQARHLLFRAGFGGTPEEVARLHALGLRKAVDHLVDYRSQPDVQIPYPAGLTTLAPAEFVKVSQIARPRMLKPFNKKGDKGLVHEVRQWWVRRMVQSPRPLEEKLVLFWHGHFATEYRTVRNSHAMFLQNQHFRDHAAGNFGQLLRGLLRDAAMLRYLDNDANTRNKPNENLAREIMELFSMGEGQGYTEKDIKEAARALTGYTFNKKSLMPRFDPALHDTGVKTIFGRTGKWNGEDLVRLILEQPATPRFLARKLFTYFVHEEPDEALVTQLAKILKDSKYELAPLLKAIFLSQEFYSTRSVGRQIKDPAQLVIGTVRTLQIQNTNPVVLAHAMLTMNQELFDPPNVKGWDGGQAWLNTTALFARNNFAATLIGQGTVPVPKQPKAGKPIKVGKKRLAQALANAPDLVQMLQANKIETAAGALDYFSKMLLAVPLAEKRRAEVLAHLGQLPPAARWPEQRTELNQRFREVLVLIMTAPEYQLT